jgi:phosphatidylserine synthase
MTMNPGPMAIAAMTVMLWIMWSDTIRRRRPSQILYVVRIALYLVVTGIIVLNMVRYPEIYSTGARIFSVLAVVVGLVGAGYFARRLVLRR